MPKSKSMYPEINDIREDLDSLKNNVVELTRHIKKDGSQQTRVIKRSLLEQLSQLEASSQKQFKAIESNIKEKPAQSVAIAFGVGVVASFLLNRR